MGAHRMKSKSARLKLKCWKLFSQYIRLKYARDDGNCQCFTCNKVSPWKEMQCGHGISGRGGFILFFEEVCRPQCYGCNVGRGGYYEIFIPKLIDLYTKEQYEKWVIEARKPFKRTVSDYEDLIDELNKQLIPLIDKEG